MAQHGCMSSGFVVIADAIEKETDNPAIRNSLQNWAHFGKDWGPVSSIWHALVYIPQIYVTYEIIL